MMKARVLLTALAALSLAAVPHGAQAQKHYGPGVTDTTIRIGNTIPYSGPASATSAIAKSEAAYFKMLNEQGGVNGRKIEFLSLDDAYNPAKTVEQVRRLVEEEQVLLIFSIGGTPTNAAVQRYLNGKKVPQLFAASGAAQFGDPDHYPWTTSFTPSYFSSGKIYGKYIIANVKDARVAVLYQNDDYGRDYLAGLKSGLGDDADRLIVGAVTYEPTDPVVDSQIATLQGTGANVFVNVPTPKFGAQAIRKAYEIGWRPIQLISNTSASVGAVLIPAGLDKSVGIISAQYFKDFNDPAWTDDKGMQDFAAFMKAYAPDLDPKDQFTIQGYSTAQALVHVLRQCGDELTRENAMLQAKSLDHVALPLLLPGITLNSSPTQLFPLSQQQLVKFDGKSWVRFGEIISGS
jgi:branched-chain amino acid transport system substrate-binding protein